jgi:DMSO/TMAO reductase YedYZ molybdopterin-dependent catalytic subunit
MRSMREPVSAKGVAWPGPAGWARLSRRELIRLLGVGGGALAAAGPWAGPAIRQAWAQGVGNPMAPFQKYFVQDVSANFYALDATVLGADWWTFTTDVLPATRLFLRSRYKTPTVDKATWSLRVTGDAIARPLTLTYDDLNRMRSLTAVRYHECNGNGGIRGFGLVGQVEWHYVPIGEILDRVRPTTAAVQALFWSGVDGPDTGRPIDIAELRARHEVIGLAYGMNGKDLPSDHGGPVRALVPGWGGAASVKWLSEIRIAGHRFWTRMNAKEEALVGPPYPAPKPGPNDEFTMGVAASDVRGPMAARQKVKSHLNLPIALDKLPDVPPGYPLGRSARATLRAGQQTMTGAAYSPEGIQRVEYSADGGATWAPATLVGPTHREVAWVRFRFSWNAVPGDYTLMTRATDRQGNVQPARITPNQFDLLDNSIARFEVRVA